MLACACPQDLSPLLLYLIGIRDAFDDDGYYDVCGALIDTLIGTFGDVHCESAECFINNLVAYFILFVVVMQFAHLCIRIRMPACFRLLPAARASDALPCCCCAAAAAVRRWQSSANSWILRAQ